MADLFQLESGLTESSSPSGLSPASSSLDTGDLRRNTALEIEYLNYK